MSVIYKGGGFLQGIPARDLTAAEWAALSEADRDLALASRLYVLAADVETAVETGSKPKRSRKTRGE